MSLIYVQRPKVVLTHTDYIAIQGALAIAVISIDATKESPWNPKARRGIAAVRAKALATGEKVRLISGVPLKMPEYVPGEEKHYFTKES